MLPGVVAVVVVSHSRRVVSHYLGNSRVQQQLSRRAAADFRVGNLPVALNPLMRPTAG